MFTLKNIFLIIFFIIGFIAISPFLRVSAAQTSTSVMYTTSAPLELPQNFHQAKNFVKPILNQLPSISKKIFSNEVKPVWSKMFNKLELMFNHYWSSYIKPKINFYINKLKNRLSRGLKKNEPKIKNNFQKQTKIYKKDIKNKLPSLREKIWQQIQYFLH